MNERFKQLWDQAALSMAGQGTSWEAQTHFMEKYAELIVRECSDVVFRNTGPRSALNVLEHFGLGE